MADVDQPPAGPELDDESLMQRLAAGHAEVLETLHARYARLVFGVAARTLDQTAAEEIVQEVFVTVWRRAETFDPARGTFRAWLLRIAHVRVLNELRRRGRRRTESGAGAEREVSQLSDPGQGPGEEAWRAQRQAIVRAAVDSLPTPQRQALRMAFLDELSHEQVAAELDVPLGTAKSRIRAGLQTLRLRLAPLLAAGLAVAGLAVVGLRDAAQRREQAKLDAALTVLTASDHVNDRLVAVPGVPSGAHGHYFGRPGGPVAVFTTASLPPARSGHVYRAWALVRGAWSRLGEVRTDGPQGRTRLIVEGPSASVLPEAVKVTLEPAGETAAPTGPDVLAWPAR